MERCTRCILPKNVPGVEFDLTGTCSYCQDYDKRFSSTSTASPEVLRSHFERLLKRIRRKKGYDCLAPISGGRDSMYALYLLAGVYKLKVLAYNFDNGFQSEKAAQNIHNGVKKYGVDLVIYKPREDVLFRLYRTFLIRAGEFCSPCNMEIWAAANRIARQNKIRFIMNGFSDIRISGIEGMSSSVYSDRRYYLRVVDGYVDKQTVEPYLVYSPYEEAIRRLTHTGPESIPVLKYFHPGTRQIDETLKSEFGWMPPSGELEHGDCKLNPLKDYLMNRRWGCSELTQAYSALVRIGELSREEALRKAEEEEVRTPPPILPTFLEKIGLTPSEFDESRNRHFSEYPNYESSTLYRLGKKAYALIHSAP